MHAPTKVSNELLDEVLEAHGGLDAWRRLTGLTAKLSLGGPFWGARGWPGVWAGQTVTLDTRREHITFAPFTAPDRVAEFTVGPELQTIRTLDGELVEEREAPRGSFPLPFDPLETRWDAIQVAYFTSAATWNYLCVPFVLAEPDVRTRELEPWDEDGETWRRLAVTFPERIANHNAEQVFYYDDAGLQRRMDYSPDATGHPPVAHYTYDHRVFDGFVFPTRRHVVLHDEAGRADHGFVAITIDVEEVTAHVER